MGKNKHRKTPRDNKKAQRSQRSSSNAGHDDTVAIDKDIDDSSSSSKEDTIRPYRTLFTGCLVQESAISTGGNIGKGGPHDMPLARDGRGRITIRGTTLAGALIATARKIFDSIPVSVCASFDDDITHLSPSAWNVFNSHLDLKNELKKVIPKIQNEKRKEQKPKAQQEAKAKIESIEPRQGVGIRQDTGASAEGVLFDAETLPRGTKWDFLIEVDTSREDGELVERMAAAALLEWSRGRCWIGRSVARGMGWLRLENLKALQLKGNHWNEWPDSSKKPSDIVEELEEKSKKDSTIILKRAEDFQSHFKIDEALQNQNKRWHYAEINGKIVVGKRDNGYGLDALSICGHDLSDFSKLEQQIKGKFIVPEGQDEDKYFESFNPDSMIILTKNIKGELEPFIPGSGLRGPLRHALSRLCRMNSKPMRDPNVKVKIRNAEEERNKKSSQDIMEELFGDMEHSAKLLVRDAYLTDSCKQTWRAVLKHSHAEDEFTGGAFCSSKFNKVLLLKGEFEWKMVLSVPNEKMLTEYITTLKPAWSLAESGHLPLGGDKWRGAGWVAWKDISIKTALAGEDEDHEDKLKCEKG